MLLAASVCTARWVCLCRNAHKGRVFALWGDKRQGLFCLFSSNHVKATSSDWVTACNCNLKAPVTDKYNDCAWKVLYCVLLPFYHLFFTSVGFCFYMLFVLRGKLNCARLVPISLSFTKIWELEPCLVSHMEANSRCCVIENDLHRTPRFGIFVICTEPQPLSHCKRLLFPSHHRHLHRSASDYIQVTFSCIRAHS